ncbi:hypothetical protein [Halomicrobium salinisoli]|uniref:hypothetical protein n=1 Tax=Halomicrobium salinisoli TaxID=2878391 RepID=UPI001CEFCB40|nr:hypothetical protein [Halomicrobium salinisoli]
MSPATRQRVVDQMGSLKQSTRDYLAETDVKAPGAKTAKLIEMTGSGGKRALRALSDGNRKAADTLLKLHDDVATQRAMVRAWERGDISTKELATALRRYDSLDREGKEAYQRLLDDTGSDGISFVSKLDEDQTRSFLGSACRRIPVVSGGSVAGSDRLHAAEVIQGSQLVDDSCSDGLSVTEQTEYRKQVVRAASKNEDISATAVITQIENVGSQTRRTRLKLLLKDTGEDGIRFIRKLDTDQQQKLLDIDKHVDTSDFESNADMGDWRHSLAVYQQRSAVSDAEIEAHIENTYRAATSKKIDDREGLIEPVANLKKGSRLGTGSFRRYDNELKRTVAYAKNPDIGHGTVKRVEVEPDFLGTDKDVDAEVVYQDGTTHYVEFKRLNDNPSKRNIIKSVFEKKENGNSVNEKFRQIDDEVPKSENARIGELKIRYTPDGLTNEQDVRDVIDAAVTDGRKSNRFSEIHLDTIRIVPENGEPFDVDLTKYKQTYP